MVEKWYAKVVNKLLPNYINLPIQMHRWRLLELTLAQEIDALKATDFYQCRACRAFTCPVSKVMISSGSTNGMNRLSGQKKRIIATSSEPVSTQFLQPITTRIGDYSYPYIQYDISITLHHTIPVWMTLIFFWPVRFLCFFSYKYLGFQTYDKNVNYLESLLMLS